MGLIKAALGSLGVIGEQFKDVFYCEAIPANLIMVKGRKKDGKNDNIISDGSVLSVADGQCALIVEQGRVVDICAEPGEYTYDSGTQPSVFYGSLSETIPAVLQNIGKRFTFGGVSPTDQRIYYFNTKELIGNKYGTPSPVPFRVVDERAGIDIDISIRCFGEYSYRVTNPVLFYTNVCGNAKDGYSREEIDSQLKSELLTALQPAFAKISDMGVRYSALPGHTQEIADALNEVLSGRWRDQRGIEIVAFGVSSVKAGEEDERMIKEMQRKAALTNPALLNATMAEAAANAVQAAAGNTATGPAMAFMNLNAAQNAANAMNVGGFVQNAQSTQPVAPSAPAGAESWTCPKCGRQATGKFCPECGAAKPVPAAGWTCSCGAVNKGKFCSACGKPKPAGLPKYRCDKCGWEPEDPANPPKFCPECGDPFDEGDLVQ